MPTRAHTLRAAASCLALHRLWTGPNFAGPDGGLSITAAVYHGATGEIPSVFATDENASLDLIHAHDDAMAAIAHLSASLDTEPPTDTNTGEPDHLEHIERYAAEAAFGDAQPPTEDEVIGRILRAAAVADAMYHPNPAPRKAA